MSSFPKSSLDFIKELEKNNNKEWFAEHKSTYEIEKAKVIMFADTLLNEMNTHDNIQNESGKKCLHRIYRDVRFSKNKTPYKNNWPISFVRATKYLRGGYYVHIQPGQIFIGCGFWDPSKEDLLRIRQQITLFGDELIAIIEEKKFKKNFGTLEGDKLVNGPKGFEKDDQYIELLKYKQFLVSKTFTDEEALKPDFAKTISDSFKDVRPFLNFMSEALTTDVNGEPLF